MHREPMYVVAIGLGLAYLAILGAFALAFTPPPAIGLAGFAIVAVIVLAVVTVIAQFLEGGSR
jgi:hypothetical protein